MLRSPRCTGLSLLLAGCAATQTVPQPTPNTTTLDSSTADAVLAVAPLPIPNFAAVDEEVSTPEGEELAEPDPASATCQVARSNLQSALNAVLSLSVPTTPATARVAWNHRTPLLRLPLVDRRYALQPEERSLLQRNGFVVFDRRRFHDYSAAYHEVYQSQLPLYVSADSIFHAVYQSNDSFIADLEANEIAPKYTRMLDEMHSALPGLLQELPHDVARDLDVYLTVARGLLRNTDVPTLLGDDELVRNLRQRVVAANEMVPIELFGRRRMVDFSQFQPRGHYASRTALAPYFRSAMWASRLEFNLVSRSSRSSHPTITPDPSETPREAVTALALAVLAERSQQLDALRDLDRAWGVLAGRREDVSVDDLLGLKQTAGITDLRASDTFQRLRTAIGDRFQRTARFHYMPQGSDVLPAITTLLGPRIVADTAAVRRLVHSEVNERYDLHAGDIAYVLGSDRGLHHLQSELQSFSRLRSQLEVARAQLRATPDVGDAYRSWLDAIAGLNTVQEGSVPSFTETEAFQDLRVNSITAAYAQLRHNFVLIAAQSYDEGGCEIPDSYVEPAVATYDGLLRYIDRMKNVVRTVSTPERSASELAWLERSERIIRALRTISLIELRNVPLPPEAQRFLGMVAEIRPGGTGGPPTYTGWYFDLFRTRVLDGLADARMIADFHTSSNSGLVSYVGAEAPRLGVFVIDTNGAPRVAVGPVAAAYEWHAPLERRLTDQDARNMTSFRAPWRASYTPPTIEAPPLRVSVVPEGVAEPGQVPHVSLQSSRNLGMVELQPLDHHGIARRTYRVRVGTRPVQVRTQGSLFRVRVGNWSGEFYASWSGGGATFGGMPAPSEENQ